MDGQILELSNSYIYEIGRQFSFLSAFLCGFSATFLGTMIVVKNESASYLWIVRLLIFCACLFLISLVAYQGLTLSSHPEAPAMVTSSSKNTALRIIGFLSLMLGLYGLGTSIGLTGFLKSRQMGIFSMTLAVFSLMVLTWMIL